MSTTCERLIETAPIPMLCLNDEDGYTIRSANTAFLTLHEGQVSFIGRSVLDLYPEQAGIISGLLGLVHEQRTGEAVSIAVDGRNPDGRSVTVSCWPIDVPGEPASLVLQSESSAGSDELREVNRRLLLSALNAGEQFDEAERDREQRDALLAGFADGVIVLDRTGQAVLANGAAHTLWGLATLASSAERGVGLQLLDGTVVADDDWPTLRALRGERFTGEEFRLISANEERRIQCSGHAVHSRDGGVDLAVVIIRDVTALRDLERFREDYLALISHDLRGPLTAIGGYAHWLRRQIEHEPGNHERWFDAVEEIEAGAQRMSTMIAALLESSQLEAGTTHLDLEPANLADVVRASVLRAVDPDDQGRLIVTAPDTVLARIDPGQIERVLANFIQNALKFAPPSGPIRVAVLSGDEELIVSVSDEGPGIAPDSVHRLFHRYQRLAPESGTEGHGLGLYIARLIVEAHGGRTWAESEPGKGSTFSFALPGIGRPQGE